MFEIVVTQGEGSGHTPLSAFDAALVQAGIHNYNLIPLSSVIPAGSKVERGKHIASPHDWGHRLYVVMATGTAMTPGTEIWAGLGWVQAEDGRGLLVEHTDASHKNVVELIHLSLEDMVRSRGEAFGEVQYVVQGGSCVDRPVCVLTAAVYLAKGWPGAV